MQILTDPNVLAAFIVAAGGVITIVVESGCHAPVDVSDFAQTLYSREFRGCAVWKMLPEIGAESRRQGSGAGASDGLIYADLNSDVRMEPGSGDGGGFWIQGPCTCGRRTGRATISVLRINDSDAIEFRRLLLDSGHRFSLLASRIQHTGGWHRVGRNPFVVSGFLDSEMQSALKKIRAYRDDKWNSCADHA